MSEKFPYGYDLDVYVDKAFEQMKADFPWATRWQNSKVDDDEITRNI